MLGSVNALLNGDEVAVWLGSQDERSSGTKLRLRRAWGVGKEAVELDAVAAFLADGADSNRGFAAVRLLTGHRVLGALILRRAEPLTSDERVLF